MKDVEGFRELIVKKGYSQRSFGRVLGISESYVAQIANGIRNPGPKVAKNITDVLDVDFGDIFFIESVAKANNRYLKY